MDTPTFAITAWSNPGIYSQDADGIPWATFDCVNSTHRCQVCGKEITRGWVRGKLGKHAYICREHVRAEWESADALKEETRP